MFYFSLANVPPQFRSQLHNIFVVGIARSKDIRLFGLGQILHDFVTTINRLRTTGITFRVCGKDRLVHGDLVFAVCDSPAAAQLGGFKESSSFAWKTCRRCNCDADSVHKYHIASQYESRDMTTHMEQCKVLEDATLSKANKEYWSKIYGINYTSPLCQIEGFPVTQNLIQDSMHCLLEGVTAHVMALYLNRQIFEMDQFSLQWLNSQLQSYPYSYQDMPNKPGIIERRHIIDNSFIKQKASCLLTMCYVLPIILGEVNEETDPYYHHFLGVIKITLLAFSPNVDAATADHLELLDRKSVV
jgi:hypothetical protein